MSESLMHPTAAARSAGGYLTFYLAEEEYGVEILKVREIIGLLPITRVPRTPPTVLGVVNLRGKVIPVLDLRARLGMPPAVDPERPCIIVAQAGGVAVGVLVDEVSEVVNVAAEEIADPPEFGVEIGNDLLLGIAKGEGRIKLLLDIDRVLTQDDLDACGAAEAEVAA